MQKIFSTKKQQATKTIKEIGYPFRLKKNEAIKEW